MLQRIALVIASLVAAVALTVGLVLGGFVPTPAGTGDGTLLAAGGSSAGDAVAADPTERPTAKPTPRVRTVYVAPRPTPKVIHVQARPTQVRGAAPARVASPPRRVITVHVNKPASGGSRHGDDEGEHEGRGGGGEHEGGDD